MGKKYIIELEEPEMFDERKYYQCSQMPWWAVSENIVENLTPYTEPDLEQVRKEAYEQGVIYGRMCEREKIFKTLEKFSDGDTDFDRLTMGDFRTIMELSKHLQKMKES